MVQRRAYLRPAARFRRAPDGYSYVMLALQLYETSAERANQPELDRQCADWTDVRPSIIGNMLSNYGQIFSAS